MDDLRGPLANSASVKKSEKMFKHSNADLTVDN